MRARVDAGWKLILAAFVALGTTAAMSAMVATWWAGGPRIGEVVFEDPIEVDEDERHPHYDLPGHSGCLVAVDEDEPVGLPQLEADYRVDIRGDVAIVVVRQTFENDTDSTVEPVYEFPLYSKAAVYGMTMEIGERRIEAEVERKEEARRAYEEAKREGKKAALLDQDRPNLFTQRVANVEPGQRVDITLRYTHPVPKDRGAYHLTVPLAVPERFTPPELVENRLVDADGADDPGASPGGVEDSERDFSGPDDVSLSVRIDGGMPVSDIRSRSHRTRIETLAETVRQVDLADEEDPTDRHFRLAYRLAGDEPQIGVDSYWDEEAEQGYFSTLVEPPATVAAEDVPAREMVFVIDTSGSMRGERMEAAREFLIRALDHLRPDDYFRIILFANDVEQFRPRPTLATPENVDQAKTFAESVSAGGGTNLAHGLQRALGPEPVDETLRMVTVVTDVEVSNEFAVIRTIRKHIDRARMFALGIGGDVNRYLLEEIGRAGRGFSEQIEVDDRAQRAIDSAVRRLQNPVLTDISVDWEGLEVDAVLPYPPPDVFEGGSVRLHGRYEEPGTHRFTVEGKLHGHEPVTYQQEIELAGSTGDGDAIKLGWARQQIEDHMHQLNTPEQLRARRRSDADLKERITEIGLDYSLTTQWTSLVAIADDAPTAAEEEAAAKDDGKKESATRGDGGSVVDFLGESGGGEQSGAHDRGAPKSEGAAKVNKERQKRMASPEPSTNSKGSGGDELMIIRGDGRRGAEERAESAKTQGEVQKSVESKPSESAGGSEESPSEPESSEEETTARVDIRRGRMSVKGELDRESVARIAEVETVSLRRCYENALDDGGDLEGGLTVSFRIGASGDVDDVQLADSSLDSSDVERCVLDHTEEWTFPEPSGEQAVRVSIPIEFSTSDE